MGSRHRNEPRARPYLGGVAAVRVRSGVLVRCGCRRAGALRSHSFGFQAVGVLPFVSLARTLQLIPFVEYSVFGERFVVSFRARRPERCHQRSSGCS